MKKRISDMMDCIEHADVELNQETPLSSQRIKELTMNKITRKKNMSGRRLFRVLAAAAVIVTLTVTVFAAGYGADWFREFFAKRSEAELSLGQVEYIDENAVTLDQSQTIGGYTVTLESYISDGNSTYVKVKITAPEGKTLTDWVFDDVVIRRNDGEEIKGVGWMWRPLEGEAAGTYLLSLDGYVLDVQSGDAVVLELGDLGQRCWQFELKIPDSSGIELITEPVTGYMVIDPRTDETIEVTVTSACLRAMTLRCEYELVDAEDCSDYQFRSAAVVMKDGTTVDIIPGAWGYDPDDNTSKWVEFGVTVPLDLDEVDYVEFPDGVRIYAD